MTYTTSTRATAARRLARRNEELAIYQDRRPNHRRYKVCGFRTNAAARRFLTKAPGGEVHGTHRSYAWGGTIWSVVYRVGITA